MPSGRAPRAGPRRAPDAPDDVGVEAVRPMGLRDPPHGLGDTSPLLTERGWPLLETLDGLPGAATGAEALPLLLVAAAASQGPTRVHELADKALGSLRRDAPRLEQRIEEAQDPARRECLRVLADDARVAARELPELRTRAANDREVGGVRRAYGLRRLDLPRLALHVGATVGAAELTRRPGPAGLAFGLRLVERPPDLELAEAWMARLMGSAPLRGVLPFWPRELGRVVLVLEDGRLAYDPGPGRAGEGW